MTAHAAPFIRGTPKIDALQRERFAASLSPADWPAPPNVRAFTTLRGPAGDSAPPFGPLNLGTRSGDDVAAVLHNRDNLQFFTGMPALPCWLHQVHGTRVIAFDRHHPNSPSQAGEGDRRAAPQQPLPPLAGEEPAPEALLIGGARRADGGQLANESPVEPEADAAVTRTPGVVLAILTADCLPVLFCAADGSEIAAAHAGWRGLSAGVLGNTLAAMRAPRRDIMAWLGPAIAASSYEVGVEVRAAFIAHDAAAAAAFTATRPGHWHCDLYALARQRLHAAGVTRVFGGSLDTFSDTRLHSYRRDGEASGRMASLVWLAPAQANGSGATVADRPAG